MTDFTKIMEAVGKQGDAFCHFVKANDERIADVGAKADALIDRLEQVEAGAAKPGLTAGKRRAAQPDFKTYETGAGQIHELPFNVKMADVIRPDKEPDVSFERWLGAAMAGERCSDTQALEYAREQKQLVSTSTGVLIPEEFQSRWIDLIRAQSALNAAGMSTIIMDAKTQTHSAVITDPAASWHTEAASISADNPTFALRQLTAKTLVVRCQGSVELAQDSPDFGAQLASVMAKAMAVEMDRVGFVGSGTPPEPQGILGAAGVADVAGVGTPTDYSDLLGGVQTLLEANNTLDVASANAIMSPRSWATFEALATGMCLSWRWISVQMSGA